MNSLKHVQEVKKNDFLRLSQNTEKFGMDSDDLNSCDHVYLICTLTIYILLEIFKGSKEKSWPGFDFSDINDTIDICKYYHCDTRTLSR